MQAWHYCYVSEGILCMNTVSCLNIIINQSPTVHTDPPSSKFFFFFQNKPPSSKFAVERDLTTHTQNNLVDNLEFN